jgi:hypothetical protein
MVMRREARLITLLILVSFSSTARAHEFIAVTDGGQRRGLAHPLPFEPNLFIPAEEDMLFMTEMEIPPGKPGLERRLRLTIETDGLTATGKVVLAK